MTDQGTSTSSTGSLMEAFRCVKEYLSDFLEQRRLQDAAQRLSEFVDICVKLKTRDS